MSCMVVGSLVVHASGRARSPAIIIIVIVRLVILLIIMISDVVIVVNMVISTGAGWLLLLDV